MIKKFVIIFAFVISSVLFFPAFAETWYFSQGTGSDEWSGYLEAESGQRPGPIKFSGELKNGVDVVSCELTANINNPEEVKVSIIYPGTRDSCSGIGRIEGFKISGKLRCNYGEDTWHAELIQ